MVLYQNCQKYQNVKKEENFFFKNGQNNCNPKWQKTKINEKCKNVKNKTKMHNMQHLQNR